MRDYRETLRKARAEMDVDEDTLDRVHVRMNGVRPRRPFVAAAGVATGLAFAAVLLWALAPPPRVDRSLDGAGTVALGDRVEVQAGGTGSVSGDARDMRLRWNDGELYVEVEPHQGVALAVQTEEAEVRVVGTGFTVVRDALGTRVDVRHGRVAVTCVRGAALELGTGEAHTCLPTTAAGSLGRALARRDTADATEQLTELDDALALPDAVGPVRAELRVLRAGALLAAGRRDEALAEAEGTLAEDAATRPVELHRLAARLRMEHDDCAGALPHLEALAAAGSLGDDAAALEHCRALVGP